MKKASIRILALFMAIIMISGIVPYSLFTFQTNATSNVVKEKLDEIKDKWGYGSGHYFSVNGKACNHDAGGLYIGNDKKNGKCYNCETQTIAKSEGKKGNKYSSGRTCWGFASYCFTECFGKRWKDTVWDSKKQKNVYANYKKFDSDNIKRKDKNDKKHYNIQNYTTDEKRKFFSQASVGDIIQCFDSNMDHKHSMVFYSMDVDGIYVYENNVGGNKSHTGTLAFRKRTWNNGLDSVWYNIEIQHAKDYDSIAKAVSEPVVSKVDGFIGGKKIKLASATKGATIYYTLDGSKPTTSSTKYVNDSFIYLYKETKIKAIAVKDGLLDSDVKSVKVSVAQTKKPAITLEEKSDGYKVTIKCSDKDAKIYYTTDGSTPVVTFNGASIENTSKLYEKSFKVKKDCTVKAIALHYDKGYCASEAASKKVTITSKMIEVQVTAACTKMSDAICTALGWKSSAPARKSALNTDTIICGIGDSIDLSWTAAENAEGYIINIYKNGTKEDTITTENRIYSYIPYEAGEYLFTVQSFNFAGESEVGDGTALATVKPDVKVKFCDDDGKLIEEQTVTYGHDATPPVHPNKEGYNWKNWSGKYTEVVEDTTVTAVYTPLQCTIKFEDENGTVLSSSTVNYGGSCASVPSAPVKDGFTFVDWSKKSGEGDSYTNVNGSAVFEPVYKKNNSELPLTVTISSAVRSDDAKRYTVSLKIANSTAQTTDGKIIAVIKTANDKVVAIEQKTVSVAASAANQAESLVINSTSDAMKCEVYVVGVDTENSNKTGGALSEKATASVTRTSSASYSYWSGWSDWSETPATASSTKEVEAKEQIRTRSKETTTGTSPELDGWTQTGTNTEYGAWSSWSSWSETKQTASETKAVETRKVYRYFHYCVGDGAATIAPSTAYAYGKKGPHYQYYTSKRSVDQKVTVGGKSYECAWCGACQYGCKYYYYDKQVTQYRYRTRTATTTYNFERWTDWSNWSDTGFAESQGIANTDSVEYRMVYRYRNLLTGTSSGSTQYIVNEDTSGTSYSLSGNLTGLGTDYAGKYATVMVYKGNNTDPTEAQIEYIGQIKLGTGNSYNFTFIPKEEISMSTGNYIVSLGIAGTTRLVNNVETIEAPWKYKVTFYDLNNTVIKEDIVNKGEDAVAPALPEVEGMKVTWDKSLKNVIGDMNIYPETETLKCTVIYVDWANSRVLKTETVDYGSKVNLPASPEAEGKIFRNWQVNGEAINANYTVTGNTVIESYYDDIVYTVSFLNKDGSVFSTQDVPYGSFADIPEENPVADGFTFISWNTDTEWWDIKEDTSIEPIFIYEQTVETPEIIVEDYAFGSYPLEMSTFTEGAVIHYTTDGSEPTEEDLVFDDVVWFAEKTIIKAKAFKPGMNSSATAEITLDVNDYNDIPSVEAVTDIAEYEIGNDYAKLCMKISNPVGWEIKSYGYHITNEITEEEIYFEGSELIGSTDEVIGRLFRVPNLENDSLYSYYFYVVFDVNGEEVYFDSTPKHTDGKEDYFVIGDVSKYFEGESSANSDAKISINNPSTTTINYGYTLILHTKIENLPDGAYVVWSFDGESIKGDGDNEKCSVYVVNSGDTTVKATVCDKDGKPVLDENGKEISSSVKLTAKAGFFQKLIAFFKNLFRVNMVIDG